MKLNRQAYLPGEQHLCRVCDTALARRDAAGVLRPLASKGHVVFLLENGSFYRVNLCQECIRTLDFNDRAVVMSIWANDLAVWRRLEEQAGVEDAAQRQRERAAVKPLAGFHHVEKADAGNNVRLAKRAQEFTRKLRQEQINGR